MQEKILDNAYKLLEEIGRGGFGAVFRGVRLGAEGSGQFAIKLLNKNPKMRNEDLVRFQKEATLMSQLLHPGIVTVFELSEDNGAYFIVMEFVSGPNLREYVKNRGGKLSLSDIIEILVQATEALDYVHSHSIIHRDIKPQNILIEERRDRGEMHIQVKLVDFGVARLGDYQNSEKSNTPIDSIVGTYAYMAPEATGLVNWPLDSRADIYSLGIIAYELIAGRVPFYDLRNEDVLRAHVEREPLPMRIMRGQEVPEILENIVMKCISKNPSSRYQSMFGLLCDLKRVQNDLKLRGMIDLFEIAKKDFNFGKFLDDIFVGRQTIVSDIMEFIDANTESQKIVWSIIKGGIGVGKSRCLNEIKKVLNERETGYLYLHFSESEQRLPFQSLSLAINEYLSNFQRINKGKYIETMESLFVFMNDKIEELWRFIPLLRQYAGKKNIFSLSPLSSTHGDNSADDHLGSSEFSIKKLDKRYIAPNQSINDAFIMLLTFLLGKHSRHVFLMDDLHLADNSSLTLLLYILERQMLNFPVSIIFTIREKSARANLLLENFMRMLTRTDIKCFQAHLFPFNKIEIHEFLSAIGVKNPSEEFIETINMRSGGTITQIKALVKQMLAQDILVPSVLTNGTDEKWIVEIAWERFKYLQLEFVNVELLIASIDSLEKRELQLMCIAAVSHDACEFEYFRIDQEYSHLELETRLLNLVRKNIFEIVGDEQAPIQRRAFIFTHEKIRNAVLSTMDMEARRQVHCLLANRIEAIYRNPRREQILSLAKHYDGASDKVNPARAVKSFLKAARIYIDGMEKNLARYYIDKAMETTSHIGAQRERLQCLRECYETEYIIQAAQGNLVEASEVCRNLIEITYEPNKRETLQIFWAQLLLGLGRHRSAYIQARMVIEGAGIQIENKLFSVVAFLNLFFLGTFVHKYFSKILDKFFTLPQEKMKDIYLQGTLIMALAHFHGEQEKHMFSFLLGTRLQMWGKNINKWNIVFRILQSVFLIRKGYITQAYRNIEECEEFLKRKGMNNQYRWSIALRSLWLDYPLGRMERLITIIDSDNSSSLVPASGIMHFESLGIRAWVMLLSPSCKATQKASQSEPVLNRRRSDRKSQEKGNEQFIENNVARRILDSGENSQYTALSVFADALRFALNDKIEPLRRATEQLKRQNSVSQIGDTFSDYAHSFQSLVLGHQHEALKSYEKATIRIIQEANLEIISLIVADAIRLAAILLPLLARAFGARGWPWGDDLRRALVTINNVLIKAEGKHIPRRNSMTHLFKGFLSCLAGQRKESFTFLEKALVEARSQKSDLIECISLSLLGAFAGPLSVSRAIENFEAAFKVAKTYKLFLLERQILELAKKVNIDLEKERRLEEKVVINSSNSRDKQSTIGLNEIVAKMQNLHASSTINQLLMEASTIVMASLRVSQCLVYLLEKDNNRQKFVLKSSVGFNNNDVIGDRWIQKLLPHNGEDPIRILPMSSDDIMANSETINTIDYQDKYTTQVEKYKLDEDEKTIEIPTITRAAPNKAASSHANPSEALAASHAGSEEGFETVVDDLTIEGEITREGDPPGSSKMQIKNQYLVLLAIISNRSLMGWMAIPSVPANIYSSRALEQDLVLLGLHVGHILSRVHNVKVIDSTSGASKKSLESPSLSIANSSSKLFEVVDGELPKDIILENAGKVINGYQTAWRIYGLKPKRLLVLQWKIEASPNKRAQQLGELLARHLRFFVYSIRQSSEQGQLENLLIKLSSDIMTILESSVKKGHLDSFNLNILFWDSEEHRAVEGDFGGEHYSFSGNCEIEREYLQEIRGILASDRLVYHERIRKVLGSGGWLFSPSTRAQLLFPLFAQVDFVEQFFLERRKNGAHLGKLLGLDRADRFPVLGVFSNMPDGGK